MNDDQVSRTIEEFERALVQDELTDVERDLAHQDPAFLKRFAAVHRADTATFLSVFLLLAGGAALLTVGLATLSLLAWATGAAAFLVAVVLDEHHKRALQHPR